MLPDPCIGSMQAGASAATLNVWASRRKLANLFAPHEVHIVVAHILAAGCNSVEAGTYLLKPEEAATSGWIAAQALCCGSVADIHQGPHKSLLPLRSQHPLVLHKINAECQLTTPEQRTVWQDLKVSPVLERIVIWVWAADPGLGNAATVIPDLQAEDSLCWNCCRMYDPSQHMQERPCGV